MLNRDKYTFCAGSSSTVDAYSKVQSDAMLAEKSDIGHKHDSLYVKKNVSVNGAIALFNGIDGEIKSSSVIVDSAGNITTAGKIKTGEITYTSIDGTDGQVLTTDGSGNISFKTVISSSGGDMAKSTYDINGNGKVDLSENSEKVNGLTVETAVPVGAVFTDNDTIYIHPTTDGSKHIPANGTGNNGKVLTASSTAGVYTWETPSTSPSAEPTNLTMLDWNADTFKIQSSTATASPLEIPSASFDNAGLFTTTNYSKLDSIETGANKYAHPIISGYKHIPAGGAANNVLVWSADGTATWGTVSSGGGATNLFDLLDVRAGTDGGDAQNNEIILYDGTTSKWLSKDFEIGALSDTNLGVILDGQVLSFDDASGKWINKTVSGGSGSTDLSVGNRTTTTLDVISSSGNNATIPFVSTSQAGLLSSADKTKLDSVAASANNYSHPVSSGNKHVPSGGSANKILGWSSDGTATWIDAPTGSGSSTVTGLTDTTISSPANGQALIYDSTSSTWKNNTVSGSGDMLKSVYDTDGNGIVDNSEKVNNLTVQTAVPSGAIFTDTTYSVGDGGLTQKNFTTSDRTKLDSIEDNANEYIHPTTAGNIHIPTGGTVGQILVNSASGTATWQNNSGSGSSTMIDLTDTNISTPSSEQILKYNATSSKWENVDVGQLLNLDGGNASSTYIATNLDGGGA